MLYMNVLDGKYASLTCQCRAAENRVRLGERILALRRGLGT